ncbi:MAG: NAD(P)-dependent oxidoreductase [bacterium]
MIAITGGNGFVGSQVVERLLELGYPVRCLLRPHSRLQWIESLPLEIVRVDYADANSLEAALKGCTAILHFGAAVKAPSEAAYFKANTAVTKALLEAAEKACPDLSLFLFCSSQAALGPASSLEPLTEAAQPHPLTAYGKSKWAAEQQCHAFANRFPIAIIRPSAVYGPRDRDIYLFFRTIKWGIQPSIGNLVRRFSLVHVADIVQITERLLKNGVPGLRTYHVTDGAIHTWEEMAQTIAAVLGKRALRITIPKWSVVALSHVFSAWASLFGKVAILNREKLEDLFQEFWLISSQRATDELGYRSQYSLRQGVEMTVRWYRSMGWL